jgi:hypothetical protein
MAATLLTPTTTESPLGYRPMRKRLGNPLWERLNVMLPGHAPQRKAAIPNEVMRALLGDRPLDVSACSYQGWPYDLVLSDDWREPRDEPNMAIIKRGGLVWLHGAMLLTRRGGVPDGRFSITRCDERDLEPTRRPNFGIGALAVTAVDPTVYDIHLDVKV